MPSTGDNPASVLSEAERRALGETADSLSAILVVEDPDEHERMLRERADTTPARATLGALAADQHAGSRLVRGLVVDRTMLPDAFSAARSVRAAVRWERFLSEHGAEDSRALNERHRRGLTPYHVDLDERSPTLGVLRENGKLVRTGLALRDVIALPIYVPGDDGGVGVASSMSDAASLLSVRLDQRVEESGRSNGEHAGRVRLLAALPPMAGTGASPIASIVLSSLGELAELRSLAAGLRALRGVLSARVPEEPGRLEDLRALARGPEFQMGAR